MQNILNNTFINGTQMPANFYINVVDNNLENITANTTDIPFKTKIIDKYNLWNTNHLVMPFDGYLYICGCHYVNPVAAPAVYIYVNSSIRKCIMEYIVNDTNAFSGLIIVKQGDRISLRAKNNCKLASGSIYHNLNILGFSYDVKNYYMNGMNSSNIAFLNYQSNNNELLSTMWQDIPFKTKIIDSDNLWTGSSLIAPFDGVFIINGNIFMSGGIRYMTVDLKINNVNTVRGAPTRTDVTLPFQFLYYLQQGQKVSLGTNTTGNINNAIAYLHNINIIGFKNFR